MSRYLVLTKEEGTISAHGTVKNVVFSYNTEVMDLQEVTDRLKWNHNADEVRHAIRDLKEDGNAEVSRYESGVKITINLIELGNL